MGDTVREIVAALDIGKWGTSERATVPRAALNQLIDAARQGERLRWQGVNGDPNFATAGWVQGSIGAWLASRCEEETGLTWEQIEPLHLDHTFRIALANYLFSHYVIAHRLSER